METENFHYFYQSLYDIDTFTPIGSEIFLRSDMNPDLLFSEAKAVNKLFELETKSIFKLLKVCNLINHRQLFINIYPSTVLHNDFPVFIQYVAHQFPHTKDKIVFEVIESEQILDEVFQSFKKRINLIRGLGYHIALDDVGKGWSSVSMLIELEPKYIKLDRYFSLNLDESALKREIIKLIIQYAEFSNSKVVLEGIEKESELATSKILGVHIGQGFLLHKPKPLIDQGLFVIHE